MKKESNEKHVKLHNFKMGFCHITSFGACQINILLYWLSWLVEADDGKVGGSRGGRGWAEGKVEQGIVQGRSEQDQEGYNTRDHISAATISTHRSIQTNPRNTRRCEQLQRSHSRWVLHRGTDKRNSWSSLEGNWGLPQVSHRSSTVPHRSTRAPHRSPTVPTGLPESPIDLPQSLQVHKNPPIGLPQSPTGLPQVPSNKYLWVSVHLNVKRLLTQPFKKESIFMK